MFLGGVAPFFSSTRPRHRRFGPFRASEGLDSGLPEVDQPLQVVAGGHHRHREARPRLADGARQLATHLLEGRRTRARPGRAFWRCAGYAAAGTRSAVCCVCPSSGSDSGTVSPSARLHAPRTVAPVGIDVPTRVARIEDVVKVLAVVRTRRVGLDSANDLVFLVDVDRELVAEVARAVLLRPGRVEVLLAPFRRPPVGGHRTVLDQRLLTPTVVLLGAGIRWRR